MTTRKLIAALLSIFLLMPMTLIAEAEVTPAVPTVDWTFENGGTGWSTRNPWNAEAGKVVDEVQYVNRAYSEKAENVHGGEKSLRLANDGTAGYTAAGVYTSLSRSLIKQNKSLTLEGFVKVEALGAGSTVDIKWYYGAGWRNSSVVATFSAVGDWEKFTFLPAWWDSDSYLTMDINGTGTVYFDDLSFTYSDEIVFNGDFEGFGGTEASVCAGWNVNKSNISWGTDYKILEEDGNHYLEAYNRGNSQWGFLYQPILGGLTPGEPYILSVKYKGDGTNNTIPGIAIGTVSTGNRTDVITLTDKFTTKDTGDGWKTFTASFTTPEEAFSANILIDYAKGWEKSAFYDDLSLTFDGEMPAPPVFVEGVPSLRETFEKKETIYKDKNFGFEKGFDGWSVYNHYGVINESMFVQDAVKESGNSALKLTNDGIIDTQSVVYIAIPKPESGIINVSGYLRLDSIEENALYNSDPLLSGNKGAGVKAAVYYGSIAAARALAFDAVSTADGNWYKFDFPIVSTYDADMVLAIWLYGKGTAYADSIKVERTNNLLSNGSFDETANGGTTVQGVQTLTRRGAWGTNVFSETENTFSGNALRLDKGVYGTSSYCSWLYVYQTIRDLNAMPAGEYTMTVAMQTSTSSAKPNIQFSSKDGLDDEPETIAPEFEPVRVNGEWTEFMAHFEIPAEMTVRSMVISGSGIYDELFLTRSGNLPPILSCDGGNAFKTPVPGSYITAKAEVDNEENAMLVLCIYSVEGERKMLEAVEFETVSNVAERTNLQVTVRVPQDDSKTYMAESLLWDGAIAPLR